MRRFAPMIVLALAACSGGAPPPDGQASATASPASAPAAPPAPPAVAAAARKVSEANDLYEFDYAYPAQAAAIPALKALLDKDLDDQKASLIKDATADRKEAKAGGFPYHAYSLNMDWKVVADLPGWLSLSTLIGTYTGGAHGNYAFDAMVWDKAANQRRAATDLFTSKAALKAAVLKPFCAGLDRARKLKRGETWESDGSIDDFTRCVDPMEQVVILGSAGKKGFDRIGFLIAPYNAGPFAEGDYEVTVPVTPAVLAAVKPEFRGAFVGK
ncbi:MAG: hypothetical protein B7Z36_05470 [Novosphingobium sp. 12-63-9]|nr:MAG: hypothetical protein B7Z36_05470 [Novosphingobium sp. 12-63-9]